MLQLSLPSNGMTALIDGDILLYRIGFSTQDEDENIAMSRMNEYIDNIVYGCECSTYNVYLTDSKGNFRNTIYPLYKANRVQAKPKHYQFLKDYLLRYEKAILAEGQEADDALGIEQTKQGDNSIICSLDKDLNQIPGWHYNFVKMERYYVTEEEGRSFLYKQILMGDATDNIPGLPKVGPKKADKFLEGIVDENALKEKVIAVYKKYLPNLTEEEIRGRVEETARLVYIRKHEGEMWSL